MISTNTHRQRREALYARLGRPILLMGNGLRIRNLPLNTLPHRQDSTFLYFTGCDLPGSAALIDDTGCTLFVVPAADDDALWHGHVDTLEDLRERYRVERVLDVQQLEDRVPSASATLAVGDTEATSRAARHTGTELRYAGQDGDPELVDAVIEMRRRKTPEELDEHRRAAAITAQAFRAAMSSTRPGGHEAHVAALFDGVIAARGCTTGYHSIVTVRGEVLHMPHYENPLRAGQLLLLDGGAELPSGYGVDITRTWPVDGRFSGRQRAAYEAVLESQRQAIALCRVGTRYREVHLHAARVLAEWLLDEGLLLGSLDAVMEQHAASVFFPHGVGHLLGMDVHDLEQFGDRAAYAAGRTRSPHFGTAYLRLDLDLEPGHLVTIEPGFYVVPAILQDAALREKLDGLVDWEAAAEWLPFGGIRIEDDVLVTEGEPEILTHATPSGIGELEALIGSGPSALSRLSPPTP